MALSLASIERQVAILIRILRLKSGRQIVLSWDLKSSPSTLSRINSKKKFQFYVPLPSMSANIIVWVLMILQPSRPYSIMTLRRFLSLRFQGSTLLPDSHAEVTGLFQRLRGTLILALQTRLNEFTCKPAPRPRPSRAVASKSVIVVSSVFWIFCFSKHGSSAPSSDPTPEPAPPVLHLHQSNLMLLPLISGSCKSPLPANALDYYTLIDSQSYQNCFGIPKPPAITAHLTKFSKLAYRISLTAHVCLKRIALQMSALCTSYLLRRWWSGAMRPLRMWEWHCCVRDPKRLREQESCD